MNLKDILIVGDLFHNLNSELSKRKVSAKFVSEQEFGKDAFDISHFNVIVILRLNILLNSSKIDVFTKLFGKSKTTAKIIFWTHETFWDDTGDSERIMFGRKVTFMNCYTGDVFLSPYSFYFGVGGFLWSESRLTHIDLPSKDYLKNRFLQSKKNKPVCAYNTCFHGVYHEIDSSLLSLRNDLIKWMYDKGVCDVFGKNWRGAWELDVQEESRAGTDTKSWGKIKVEDSRDKYSFSICLENNLLPNYVTEKFAHAIESWLIPIYCFENNLPNLMDTSGAIHLPSDANHNDFSLVYEQICSMSFKEYYERIESLLNGYNQVISRVDFINDERNKPAIALVDRILENL